MDNLHVFTIIRGVLLRYSGFGGKVLVPPGVVRTENHCSFDNLVFCKNETVTEIIFPDGFEEIGSEACYGCTNLVSVKLPSTLKRIGDRAFANCRNLSHIDIPNEKCRIGSAAFDNTDILSSASEGCFYIANKLYKYKGKVAPPGIVEIRQGTTEIVDGAFSRTKGLARVIIPPSCIRIGSGAFELCRELKSIVIPDTVMSIGSGLFSCCSALENVVIPNCAIDTGTWPLEGCTTITDLTVSESFNSIYSRLLPNLRELRITGTAFSEISRNWFVDPAHTVIISTLPLQQFPKDAKMAAILGFAKQYCEKAVMPNSYREESLRYLRRIKKKIKDAAKEYPALLKMMVAEKMFAEDEFTSI